MRIAVCAALVVLSAPVPSAAICVSAEPTRAQIDEYVAWADLVFVGSFVEYGAIDVRYPPDAAEERRRMFPRSADYAPPSHVTAPLLRFTVDRWWKGGNEREAVVAVGTWSAQIILGGGEESTLRGGPGDEYLNPAVGERYLIFARSGPSSSFGGGVDFLHPVGNYCLSRPVSVAGAELALLGPGESPEAP